MTRLRVDLVEIDPVASRSVHGKAGVTVRRVERAMPTACGIKSHKLADEGVGITDLSLQPLKRGASIPAPSSRLLTKGERGRQLRRNDDRLHLLVSQPLCLLQVAEHPKQARADGLEAC